MTRSGRIAAIALCTGLALGVTGLTGHLSGALGRWELGTSVQRATEGALPGSADATQAASSVPSVDGQGARLSAAQDLLSARAAAVKAHDKGAWMATVDLPSSSFGGRQSQAFDNLIKLPLGQFAYGTVQLAHELGQARAKQVGPQAWVANVSGSYSLEGYDRAPRAFDATYTLVRRPAGWRIADDSDGATSLQVWDLPGLKVIRGRSALVIGNAPEVRMRDYSAIADSAVRRVSRVWGIDWNAHVVIVTPSRTEEFAGLLTRSSDDGLDQVAAITLGEIDPGKRSQGDRVVINPNAFTALQRNGRRVVITHEVTHVATRSATTRPVPIWLSEGMADYIGYSGLDLPRTRVASDLLALVRQGKGPKTLPTETDFDPARKKIAPYYSASWLAVSRLVDLYGQTRVISFYRSIAGGQKVEQSAQFDPEVATVQAFPRSFGLTQTQFVDGWTGYLRTLAQSPG